MSLCLHSVYSYHLHKCVLSNIHIYISTGYCWLFKLTLIFMCSMIGIKFKLVCITVCYLVSSKCVFLIINKLFNIFLILNIVIHTYLQRYIFFNLRRCSRRFAGGKMWSKCDEIMAFVEKSGPY